MRPKPLHALPLILTAESTVICVSTRLCNGPLPSILASATTGGAGERDLVVSLRRVTG